MRLGLKLRPRQHICFWRPCKRLGALKYSSLRTLQLHWNTKTNKENYALMISNLRLPVINGVQLLKTVKDLNPSVRTVLITENETNDKILQEYNKNELIDSFMKKPFKHSELISEVNDQVSYMNSINKIKNDHPFHSYDSKN